MAAATQTAPAVEIREASSFHVLDAQDSDGPELVDLVTAPVRSRGVRWSIERPDFFAALRAENGGWRMWVARDGVTDTAIGCLSVARRRTYVGSRVIDTCYITNFHVRPDWRGRGVADRLCWHAHDFIHRSCGELAPTLLFVHERNRQMRSRASGPRGLPDFRPIGRLATHTVSTRRLRAVRTPRGLSIHPAAPSDLAEMAALSAHVFAQRDFGPALDDGTLERWIAAAPGLGLSDFLVARERDRVVGWLGLWDDAAFRRACVVGYSHRAAFRYAVRDALSPVTGWRHAPRVGDLVGTVIAALVCVRADRPDVLRSLLAHRASSLYASGRTWLKIALDDRDTLTHALSGLSVRVKPLLAYATTPAGADRMTALDGRPLHVEAALI